MPRTLRNDNDKTNDHTLFPAPIPPTAQSRRSPRGALMGQGTLGNKRTAMYASLIYEALA